MNDLQFVCFVIAISIWPVADMVHEFYEWAADEIIAWRLHRSDLKFYRKLLGRK